MGFMSFFQYFIIFAKIYEKVGKSTDFYEIWRELKRVKMALFCEKTGIFNVFKTGKKRQKHEKMAIFGPKTAKKR
jgi:hypothetical protein